MRRHFTGRVITVVAVTVALGVLTGAATPEARTSTTAQTTQAPPAPKVPNVAGKWQMTLEIPDMGRTATPVLDLKQDADKISGTYTGSYGASPLKGTLKDRVLEFAFEMGAQGETVVMSFKCEVAPDGQSLIKGTATIGELGAATWTAVRPK